MESATSAPRLHRNIWYMGAKARVIPGFLARVMDAELDPGRTAVDLMCGSGVVSAYLADKYRVYANDVQLYSSVIARSLVEHDPSTVAAFLASLNPRDDLGREYRRNFRRLERHYDLALSEESRLLDAYGALGRGAWTGARGAAWAGEYREFLQNTAGVYPGGDGPAGRSRNVYREAACLLTESSIRGRRQDPSRRPAFLVTTYYSNIYFGLRQAVQIDSLRAAIDALDPGPFSEEKRVHYLSALLHAASVTTSGTSHFAQPRDLRKDSELRALAKRRSLDVLEVLEEYSREIAETVGNSSYQKGNKVFQVDYGDLIQRDGSFKFPAGVDLVYLDPPYTADNYSRFYHVLEVIARYDYPELDRDPTGAILKGRYPAIDERFRSNFCRRGRVEDEFRRVIQASARSGAKLVISYAYPTGLLLKTYAQSAQQGEPLERFQNLCREAYQNVRLLRRPMMHSGQGDSNLRVEELLVVCKEPR